MRDVSDVYVTGVQEDTTRKEATKHALRQPQGLIATSVSTIFTGALDVLRMCSAVCVRLCVCTGCRAVTQQLSLVVLVYVVFLCARAITKLLDDPIGLHLSTF